MHDGVDEPNPFLVNNPDGEQVEKPKMKKKYALKPEDLAQPGVGLDQLYIQSVIFGNKQGKMKLKGKGHEVNDLEKIMSMYHNWHSELAPKLEFSYFAERLKQEAGDHPAAQVSLGFALAFGRSASIEEQKAAETTIRKEGLFAFCHVLLNANEFVYLD